MTDQRTPVLPIILPNVQTDQVTQSRTYYSWGKNSKISLSSSSHLLALKNGKTFRLEPAESLMIFMTETNVFQSHDYNKIPPVWTISLPFSTFSSRSVLTSGAQWPFNLLVGRGGYRDHLLPVCLNIYQSVQSPGKYQSKQRRKSWAGLGLSWVDKKLLFHLS